ncbi:MAG: hypothetical protein QM528_03220 [Phycisphaerales bacterium]|nr:hypothetical protein [Phycisphaerales bacterium]
MRKAILGILLIFIFLKGNAIRIPGKLNNTITKNFEFYTEYNLYLQFNNKWFLHLETDYYVYQYSPIPYWLSYSAEAQYKTGHWLWLLAYQEANIRNYGGNTIFLEPNHQFWLGFNREVPISSKFKMIFDLYPTFSMNYGSKLNRTPNNMYFFLTPAIEAYYTFNDKWTLSLANYISFEKPIGEASVNALVSTGGNNRLDFYYNQATLLANYNFNTRKNSFTFFFGFQAYHGNFQSARYGPYLGIYHYLDMTHPHRKRNQRGYLPAYENVK